MSSNEFISIFYKQMAAADYNSVTPRFLWNNVAVVCQVSWSSQHPDSLGCRPSCQV